MQTMRNLADRFTQYVFADFGTFVLDRTVKSFTGASDAPLHSTLSHPAEKMLERGEPGWAGERVELAQLEDRLTSGKQSPVH
jgi:hypothetical protein